MERVDQHWTTGGRHMPQHEHASDEDEEDDGTMLHRRYNYSGEDRSPSRYGGRRLSRVVDDGVAHDYRGYHPNQELHHRHPHHREQDHDEEVRTRTPYVIPYNNGHRYQPAKRSLMNRRRWLGCIRIGTFCLLVGYLLVMIRGSQLLNEHEFAHREFPPGSRTWMFETSKGRMLVARERLERRKLDQKKSDLQKIQTKLLNRAARLRPPTSVQSVPQNEFQLDGEGETSKNDGSASDVGPTHTLCGVHARNASLIHPGVFHSRHALTSKSRVLIAGILSPIGMNLALALKEKCGVEVIAGIDPMFPNSVSNRYELQSRIQMLTTNIPKLLQPIVLPLVGLDPRQQAKRKDGKEPDLIRQTEERSLLHLRPTHIVNLASYMPEDHRDNDFSQYRNIQSPYASETRSPDLYMLHSSLSSMEQILASLANSRHENDHPHVTYASKSTIRDRQVHSRSLLANEVLANTYRALHRIPSVGVRLPSGVYGPWGREGTVVHDVFQSAVNDWGNTSAVSLLLNTKQNEGDYVYIDDIVDGLIAAMQSVAPKVLDLGTGEAQSADAMVKTLNQVMTEPTDESDFGDVPDIPSASAVSRDLLQWRPETTLREGVVQTLAWHIDRAFPFRRTGDHTSRSQSLPASGDEFRLDRGFTTCAANDLMCHKSKEYIPCASECSSRKQCLPSVFDRVADVVQNVTTECDVVLYTQSLGYDVRRLELHATYSEEEELFICNLAFLPRNSRIVETVTKSVPEEKLGEYGVPPRNSTDSDSWKNIMLDKLNGLLLYKGWFLIWVPEAHRALSTADSFMLKLTPGKFFSSDVKHALYVDEKFRQSPTIDDILFLVGQTQRAALKQRSVYQRLESGKKKKYVLPPEPKRKAILMVSPMYRPANSEGEKITVLKATKIMLNETGVPAEDPKESQSLKKQREFYERVPTFVNRVDLRSTFEPWYRYEFKHLIRTRWIVHDFTAEESRQLRCEWYQEHIQWDNELDQLSFAHVMAGRELRRRIAHEEPDDHFKPAHIEHPELMYLSDAHEWHPLDSEEDRISNALQFKAVPDHLADWVDNANEGGNSHDSKKACPMFVRIVSERVLMIARKGWETAREAQSS